VLVTCTTASGRETVKQVYGETVLAATCPSTSGVGAEISRALPAALGVLMETEIWPNLLGRCAQNGVPVLLANGPHVGRNRARYALWRALTRPAFTVLAAVCAQKRADGEAPARLGRGRRSDGNLKFDVHPDAAQSPRPRLARRLGRPILLLASTRKGEEKLLLDALRRGTASSWWSSSRAIRSALRGRTRVHRAVPGPEMPVPATRSIWETRWARCRSTSPLRLSR